MTSKKPTPTQQASYAPDSFEAQVLGHLGELLALVRQLPTVGTVASQETADAVKSTIDLKDQLWMR